MSSLSKRRLVEKGRHGRLFVNVLLAMISSAFGVKAAPAAAQAPDETAPSDVGAKCVEKVTNYLIALPVLSPTPPGTDPDRAQAWPRKDYREFRPPGATTSERFDRLPVNRIVGAASSGMPRCGRGWQVSLLNGEIVAIVDSDGGQIRGFIDGVLSNALQLDPAPAPSDCISQETAVARATAYLRLTGVRMDDLILRSAKLIDGSQPVSAASRRWVVAWDRVWNSVPFDDQSVSLDLDAQAGRLLTFGVGVALLPPAEARVDISRARASEVASAFFAANGMRPSGEADVELKIVAPTDFWKSSDFTVRNTDPNTRLAWIVRMPGMLKEPDNTQRRLVAWIDAITGDPLGGDVLTTMSVNGHPVLPGMQIGALVRRSVRIEARSLHGTKSVDKKQSAATITLVLDYVKEPLRFFGAVSGLVGKPGTKPTGFSPTHRLLIFTTAAHSHPTVLEMDARSGLLANGKGETIQASPTLWAWLRPKVSPARIVHDHKR